MKKSLALAAAILVSGCTVQIGGSDEAQPATTTTVAKTTTTTSSTTTTTTLPPVTAEEQYLLDVAEFTSLGLLYDDFTILEFGRMVCEYFSLGGDSEGLAAIIYEAGLANNSSEDLMMDFAGAAGLAVTNLCPEWSYKV